MGGGGLSANAIRGSEIEVIQYMMPVYYIHDAQVTVEEIQLARHTWKLIISDQCPNYLVVCQNIDFEHPSCISWFYFMFYNRLFDVHPMCRPLFTSGIITQGKSLVKMISLTLSQLDDHIKFQQITEKLAYRHCERGVKAVEYGIVGDVLFHTLRQVLGELFSKPAETAWKKIYSTMLRIIVPLAIAYEKNGETQVTNMLGEEIGSVSRSAVFSGNGSGASSTNRANVSSTRSNSNLQT